MTVVIPREGVRSREIGKSFQGSDVAEAFEAGSIVVFHEAGEEGVAIGMAGEGTPCATPFGLAADGLCDAA